jgi:hypothetical protein
MPGWHSFIRSCMGFPRVIPRPTNAPIYRRANFGRVSSAYRLRVLAERGTRRKYCHLRKFATTRFPERHGKGEWSLVVARHSEARLTYSKDRLVALSGVTRQFQQISNDDYVLDYGEMSFCVSCAGV